VPTLSDVTDDADLPPTTIVLVRHGESNTTVARRLGGYRTCTGLSPLGVRQAERLRERLVETGELDGAVLMSSNFPRAIETAEMISPAFGNVDIEVDAGFGEHDPGPDLDGITFAGYVDRFGAPDWTDLDADVFPGGETIRQFGSRVDGAIARAVTRHAGRTIVVTCHGGVVGVAFRSLLRLPATGGFELHTLNTSLTQFATAGSERWKLARYNDVAHLHGLPAETPRDGSD